MFQVDKLNPKTAQYQNTGSLNIRSPCLRVFRYKAAVVLRRGSLPWVTSVGHFRGPVAGVGAYKFKLQFQSRDFSLWAAEVCEGQPGRPRPENPIS